MTLVPQASRGKIYFPLVKCYLWRTKVWQSVGWMLEMLCLWHWSSILTSPRCLHWHQRHTVHVLWTMLYTPTCWNDLFILVVGFLVTVIYTYDPLQFSLYQLLSQQSIHKIQSCGHYTKQQFTKEVATTFTALYINLHDQVNKRLWPLHNGSSPICQRS